MACKQYFSYKTISVIQLREDSMIEFPGVTVCAGQVFSADELSQMFPSFECSENSWWKCSDKTSNKSVWDQYMSLLNEAYRMKPIIELLNTTKVVPSTCRTHLTSMSKNWTNQYRMEYNCDEISPIQISLSVTENNVCYTYFSQLQKGKVIREIKLIRP
jgi:hypothetical protein